MTEAVQQHTDPPEDDDTPILVAVPGASADVENKRVPFQLVTQGETDPFVCVAVRPKMARMLKVVQGLEDIEKMDPLVAAGRLDDLMKMVLSPETLAHVEERFADDDDPLDYDDLGAVLEQLVGLWYGRPTGSRPGSPGSRPTPGTPSTVRRRGGGKTR